MRFEWVLFNKLKKSEGEIFPLKYNFQTTMEQLKEKCYEKLFEVTDFSISKTDYFSWHQQPKNTMTFNSKDKGFGDIDSHYQILFELKEEQIKLAKNLYLFVQTDDQDMWNTDNPQFMVLVDGKLIRALDINHYFVELPKVNKKTKINMTVYTNTNKENVFFKCWVARKNVEITSFYYRFKTLADTLAIYPQYSKEFYVISDYLEKMAEEIKATDDFGENEAKELNKKLIAFQKSLISDYPIIEHCLGHTHIDISWLWAIDQTKEKAVRSFSNATYLLDRYPEMLFMSSSPILYEFTKQFEPILYQKIKKFVKEKRWEVEGSMYVESDTNLPSGESLIRQIYYGKKFFKDEFKKNNEILWLPDCFGFPASLPQIMKKSDINYFFTSKLDWNDTNKLPNDTFLWKGIDGSEVLAHMLTTSDFSPENKAGTTYNGRMNASQVMGTWNHYKNKELSSDIFQIYGFGDGGGGPTEEMLESALIFQEGIPGFPKVENSFAIDFFRKLQENICAKNTPKWLGELYLENHRGIYTTDGIIKKLNREAEVKISQTELISTMAWLSQKSGYPKNELEKSWKKVLVNQFHDILPGTSITKVHKEAIQRYQEALDSCDNLLQNAFATLRTPENNDKILFINTTSFTRDELYKNGKGENFLIESIPPMGIKYVNKKDLNSSDFEQKWSSIEGRKVENERYVINFNEFGEIDVLFAKDLKLNLIRSGQVGNDFILYPDNPEEFDAWNIDKENLKHGKSLQNKANFNVEKNDGWETILKLTKSFGSSQITQYIHLYKNSARIDFQTKIDWQEHQKLLKVKFPTNIDCGEARYDIQFGNISRNPYMNTSWDEAKFEVCAHKWMDLSEKAYGIAILNNGKYGHLIFENDMYMSLLRSPNYPAENVDVGVHTFTYSILPHQGDFQNSMIHQEAYALNYPIQIIENPLEDLNSLFKLPAKSHIILETIKKAEEGTGIIVRLYEANGKSDRYSLKPNFSFKESFETNLLEQKIKVTDSEELFFTPYEIKTILFEL